MSFFPLLGVYGALLRVRDWRRIQVDLENELRSPESSEYRALQPENRLAHYLGILVAVGMSPVFLGAWVHILLLPLGLCASRAGGWGVAGICLVAIAGGAWIASEDSGSAKDATPQQ